MRIYPLSQFTNSLDACLWLHTVCVNILFLINKTDKKLVLLINVVFLEYYTAGGKKANKHFLQ